MHERDRNRSLSHAPRDALYRTMTNVADDKNAGHVCLQKAWLTIEFPTVWPLATACEMRPGIDEPPLVAFDNICKPICVGCGSDHDEERVGGHFVDLVRFRTMNGNGFEMILAVRLNN